MSDALILHAIVCSSRPGRVGLPVVRWFHQIATQHGGFDAKLVNSRVQAAFYDEPQHPSLQQYEHEHTKRSRPFSFDKRNIPAKSTKSALS